MIFFLSLILYYYYPASILALPYKSNHYYTTYLCISANFKSLYIFRAILKHLLTRMHLSTFTKKSKNEISSTSWVHPRCANAHCCLGPTPERWQNNETSLNIRRSASPHLMDPRGLRVTRNAYISLFCYTYQSNFY